MTLEPLAVVTPPDMHPDGLAAWQGQVEEIIEEFGFARCELCGGGDAGGDLDEHIIAPGPFGEARAVCLTDLVENTVIEVFALAREDVAEHLGLAADLPAFTAVCDRLVAWQRLAEYDGVLMRVEEER